MTIQRPAPGRMALKGMSILVTRASAQAGELSALLRERGAETVEMATIEIVPNPFPERVARAIDQLEEIDWIVFTSRNAVEIFVRLVLESGRVLEVGDTLNVAAVGRSTASALENHGIEPDLVPDRFDGDALLTALLERGVEGQRVLVPRAEVARETLPNGLRAAGATVDVVPVYRTVPARPDPSALERLRRGKFDIVTVTSASTARNLLTALGDQVDLLNSARVACIGPITADSVRSRGIEPWVVASEHTIPGLVEAICNALEEKA